MFYEIIIVTFISLIIVYIKNGNFKLNKRIHVRGYKLLITIAAIEIIAAILFKMNLINNYIINIWLTYIVILYVTLLNKKYFFMKLFFIGNLLNFIAIIFNDYKMPVFIADSFANAELNRNLLLSGNDIMHTLLTENTKFKVLCDIILLPPPYPFTKTISIGDIFLLAGFFAFWQRAFRINKAKKHRQK